MKINRPILRLRLLPFAVISLFMASCSDKPVREREFELFREKDVLVNVPGRRPMILRTERPLNLETPMQYYLEDFTPNDVFFVRWHLSEMPEAVDKDTFRLRIHGHVERPLALSLEELKTKYPSSATNALVICAGNSRQQFKPGVPGVPWKNGAMGNARWKGVLLRDLLDAAGVKSGALEVAFNGLDRPPLESTPDFIKTLPIERAMDGEVMVAYEMNGEEIPLLNGYPLKLVVPGWYATYWVGMLSEIKVYADTFKGFWMAKAYRVPKGPDNGNETPDSLAAVTEPIHRIAVRSVFVSPTADSTLYVGHSSEIQGLAFDGGSGIAGVEISLDSGLTWQKTALDPSLGNYSWRRWRFRWTPDAAGTHHLAVRATSNDGHQQPPAQWNRSGYMKNEWERLKVFVAEQ
jgi:DMSO/TMAO reductase YedYZ molybdopterin-dependent catalytic subunit